MSRVRVWWRKRTLGIETFLLVLNDTHTIRSVISFINFTQLSKREIVSGYVSYSDNKSKMCRLCTLSHGPGSKSLTVTCSHQFPCVRPWFDGSETLNLQQSRTFFITWRDPDRRWIKRVKQGVEMALETSDVKGSEDGYSQTNRVGCPSSPPRIVILLPYSPMNSGRVKPHRRDCHRRGGDLEVKGDPSGSRSGDHCRGEGRQGGWTSSSKDDKE